MDRGALPSASSVELGGNGDELDVPAAVFCARCRAVDCAGCTPDEGARVATPWEGREAPFVRRLWRTAQAATVEGEAFFGGLEDGSVREALAFAVSAEFCAVASLSLFWLPLAYAFAPELIGSLVADQSQRWVLLSTLGLTVPALAFMMVGLHLVWALGLELGIRLRGGAPRASHCVRYALYSCGWDLVTSPFGFAAGTILEGPGAAARELGAALRVPRLATRAYLVRARKASPADAKSAVTTAAAVTGTLVLVGAIALGTALVVALS